MLNENLSSRSWLFKEKRNHDYNSKSKKSKTNRHRSIGIVGQIGPD